MVIGEVAVQQQRVKEKRIDQCNVKEEDEDEVEVWQIGIKIRGKTQVTGSGVYAKHGGKLKLAETIEDQRKI